jgi:hypothetical protein
MTFSSRSSVKSKLKNGTARGRCGGFVSLIPNGKIYMQPLPPKAFDQTESASFPKSRSDCRESIFVAARWMPAFAGMTPFGVVEAK